VHDIIHGATEHINAAFAALLAFQFEGTLDGGRLRVSGELCNKFPWVIAEHLEELFHT
jgi:hypothetical protein